MKQGKKVSKAKSDKVPRLRKPEEMSLEAWQVALRRQYATEQRLKVRNVGGRPVFSEFEVANPQTKGVYRVAIRGEGLGVNFCSCPDFATNTLGTCKHIEFLLAKLRRQRGGEAALAGGYQPPFSEVYLRYGAKREVVFKPGAECPESLKRLAAKFFDASGVLLPGAVRQFHTFLARAGHGGPQAGGGHDGHEVRCYDDALAFVSQMRDREELVGRIERAFPDGADGPAWQGLLKVPLYAYQRQGALFAAKAGRCLIADDMGLGKTIQAIAAAEILARHADIRRALVICPTSLKHQWQREIEKFAGRSAVVVEGLTAARDRLYAAEGFYKIVNYDVVHRDLAAIRRGRYDLIVLDEAQRIKNWKTRAAKAVKQLQSDCAFVLTGTPLENRLEELHSIVEFVDRHRLGPMFRFLATHQHVDEGGRVVGYRRLDEISRTLEPMLVRRTKTEVLTELPERLEKRFFVPMTDQQMRHHEENRVIVGRIVLKWRRFGYISEIDQKRLTCALQNMRMSCNSTYLLDKQTDHGHKADELASLLEEVLEDRDAKAVIFSQWLRMHELIVRRLERRGLEHVLFHGGVPGPRRKDLLARFRDDPACRLFLATDAGGVGLNLQHASVVANMDLPWNPAVLEQRIGRVHRLGQHRPVRVVNFIAKNTIEESMLGLLSFKKSVFSGVLDGGESEVFLGGTRLKQFMDAVDKAAGAIPGPTPSADADGGSGQAAQAHAAQAAQAEEIQAAQAQAGQPASAPGAQAASGQPVEGAAPPAATRGQEPMPLPLPPSTTPGAGQQAQPAHGPGSPGSPIITPRAVGDLLSAGAALLNQLGQSLRQAPDTGPQRDIPGGLGSLLSRDDATGQTYLKLPLPNQDVLQPLLNLLLAFADRGR
jgi:superfamily II DNA or RNA helicase